MISALIMGSPVRRLISPITRCRVKPHNRYAGTDDGRGTRPRLDTKRLTLMSGRWRGGPADAEAVSSCGLGGVNDDTGGPAVRDRAMIRGMDMTLRLEIFPADLDAAVDFYVRVLCFRMTKDERDDPESYVGMQRGSVHLGALRPDCLSPRRAGVHPPTSSWY